MWEDGAEERTVGRQRTPELFNQDAFSTTAQHSHTTPVSRPHKHTVEHIGIYGIGQLLLLLLLSLSMFKKLCVVVLLITTTI